MKDSRSNTSIRIITCLGIVLILMIATMFIVQAINNARVKDFWGDESFGLQGAKAKTYAQHLIKGVDGQGSPAPLDYLLIKFLDSKYQPTFASIPPNIYYRLNSMFWPLVAGLGMAFIAFRIFYNRKEKAEFFLIQVFLIGLALIAFYFAKDNMHFAVETRPYALWNSLWYVMLSLIMLRGFSLWLLVLGILLAMTSLGALVQITVLASCQFVIRMIDGNKFSDVFRETMLIFMAPLLIALYYSLHIGHFQCVRTIQEYNMYTCGFLLFWISKWVIPVIALAGVLLTAWNRQWRGCTVVFSTMLLLYCISPFINANILKTSFFFVPRQYLYYDLIFPLFCLLLAVVLPRYWSVIFNSSRQDGKTKE